MSPDLNNLPPHHPIEDSTPTHVPIPPKYANVTYITWVIFTILSILLFLLGLPYRFNELLNVQPEIQTALDQAGISDLGWAVGMFIPEIIMMLVYAIIGISIYAQKPRSFKILIVSLLLITWGTAMMNVVDALAANFPILDTWVLFSRALSWSLVMTLLLTFPNGRLHPKWAKWLLAFWYVWIWSWFFFPDLPHNIAIHGGLADPFRFVFYFGLIGIGLATQVHRYRKVASPTERQQAKWAFLGIGLVFVIAFLEEAPSALNPSLVEHDTPESVLYALISTGFFVLGSLAFPIGIAASIQQKRLWKIDYVINRGLVYALISVFLGLTFFMFYQLLQGMFTTLTDSQQPAVVALASALIAVSLFRPARNTLQRFIDHRLYQIHIDYRARPKPEPSHGFTLLEKQSRIGDYEILEMIARGGMSEIFKGRHITTGQHAAVKILLEPYSQRAEFQKRFAHEAKTISQMEHANIIKLIDFGETGKYFYIVMEFISYQTLDTQIKTNAPLSLDFTRHIIHQAAQALDYAHQRGIIHRDIKPSNLLLREPAPGEIYPQPVITDFGIAKTNQKQRIRRHGGFVGTLDYISPEQIRASDHVDHRTDIYSLGIIAFQMLTGKLPFQSDTRAGTLIAHLHQPAPNILAYNPELPDQTAFAILKAMTKHPQDRFDQAIQFAQAL
jgi:tRNA A-37 threonylcarbamoyl transferase component Bud32